MSLFFKVSDKELVRLRNDIFQEQGIPTLMKNGFSKSPFSTAWFGKDDAGGYSYEFCRVVDDSRLHIILVYINRGDRWVQLHLNIFRLYPPVHNIEQLQNLDGLQFHLPPNSKTLTRLAPEDGLIFVGMPQHKIRFFFSRSGLRRRLEQLGNLLKNDLDNIDGFVRRWTEAHKPQETDWNGCVIKQRPVSNDELTS